MVGVMIGSGIFRTPTDIAKQMGHPGLVLVLWAGGGLICLCGALTFAELSTMFPKSGGMYVFLHEGFGPRVAFIFGWSYLLLAQPMALGGIATVFSEHLRPFLVPDHSGTYLGKDIETSLITCAVIILLTAINVRGMRLGSGIATTLTTLKVLALLAIVALAVGLTGGVSANFTPTPAPQPFGLALAPVLAAILWTYDGWSDAAAVAEEIREPQRRIPRIFLLGTLGTIMLYVAVNAVYIWLVPLDEMRGKDTVAPLVIQRLIGDTAGTVVTTVILVSTLGAAHASMIVGSRVVFAQARDRLLFGFPGRVHRKYHTPAVALWVQAGLACAATLGLKHFDRLIGGFVFTMWIFYGLAGLALIVLRLRCPQAPRPYRCWGYPHVPVLFIAAAAGMTVLSIHESPKENLPWLLVLVLGHDAYSLWRRYSPSAAAT